MQPTICAYRRCSRAWILVDTRVELGARWSHGAVASSATPSGGAVPPGLAAQPQHPPMYVTRYIYQFSFAADALTGAAAAAATTAAAAAAAATAAAAAAEPNPWLTVLLAPARVYQKVPRWRRTAKCGVITCDTGFFCQHLTCPLSLYIEKHV